MADKGIPLISTAFELMGDEPGDLAQALNAVMAFKERRGYSVAHLIGNLRSDDQNNSVALLIGKKLREWDYVPSDEWTGGTERNTKARRARIYDLLKVNGDFRELCDLKFPPFLIEAPTVIAVDHDEWFTPDILQVHGFYWDRYKKYLETTLGWPPENLIIFDDSITSVVERLANPAQQEAYQSKGLVAGYVQSGKTSHFTGVIAKAADAGYRLFIVLAGTLDILREQTQRRLDKELVGKELLAEEYKDDKELGSFISYGARPSDIGGYDWQRLTGRKYDYHSLKMGIDSLKFELNDKTKPFYHPDNLYKAKARLIVIKKNPTILRKLIKDLELTDSRLTEIPALIIDDESDQASINTLNNLKITKAEKKRRTATNTEITNLLGLFPRGQYIGYTATPFANVFIDPDDAEDLFPKDFIISLSRPKHYMGVYDFYDWEAPVPEDFKSNKKAFVRSVTGEDDEPDNLQKAIDSFILAGAIKLYRADIDPSFRFKHHTMLVHHSPFRAIHRAQTDVVRRTFESAGYYGGAGPERLQKLFTDDFSPVSSCQEPDLPIPPSFTVLEKYIGECLDRINQGPKPVLTVNLDNKDDAPNFEDEPVWKILVGGTKLSRGYTIEGLTISYYRRATTQADTLMQMGRWFGFRQGYRDLVRLYIGRNEPIGAKGKKKMDLYVAFEGVCRDEEEFRERLKKYSTGEPRITPLQVPPLVPSHLLRPSSRNKMYNATIKYENFGGGWSQRTLAPVERDDIIHNQERMLDLLKGETISRHELSLEIDGSLVAFNANTAILKAENVLKFLEAYRWSVGKKENHTVIHREIEYLKSAAGDPAIDDWVLIAPQTQKDVAGVWKANGTDFSVIRRSRNVSGTRFLVYTESHHVDIAEYIAQISVKATENANSNLESLREKRRGVFLFYPVRNRMDKERKEPVNMGFALCFPNNGIPKRIFFGVRDKHNKDAVTVMVSN